MAGNSIVINVLAKVQGLTDIEKFKSKLTGLTSSAGFKNAVQGFGIGAGITAWNMLGNAIAAAPQFLAETARAAMEEEAQIKRLSAALAANVRGWDGNIAAVEEQIDANKRLAFSDDEMRDGLTKLVTATGSVSKAFSAMRVAMDLARLKNISLEDASATLVKAFAGQMRGLKDLGIELKSTATDAEILAAVEAKAAGQADAFAASHEGMAKRVGDAWQDMQEDIGAALLQGADDAANAFAHWEWAVRKMNEAAIWEGARLIAFYTDARFSAEAFRAELDRQRGASKNTAAALGALNTATAAIGRTFDKTDGQIDATTAALIDFDRATRNTTTDAKALIREIDRWRNKMYGLQMEFPTGSGGGGGPRIMPRQHGGPVEPGQTYLVGEGGKPELFVPRQAGTIVPGSMTNARPIQNTIIVQVDGRELARVLDERQYWALQTAPVSTRAS